ncbi:4-alpha-glucanotransferase [Aurantiacibacter luteus]|uniref:4-alpha-glucanotransferase n=1 Tax=Aurantiacibacter luteus TaxID=1581420 RepID=A0A0G9MW51_9SPHN|nr:4-alpha-glucanotransferase [Aurantiacibacter luteus]KLE34956.1 4-alpha-glucanotransferase [Aurantiacibacter luteus]
MALKEALHALATAAGVAREWRDVDGHDNIVSDETLDAVLRAMGFETQSAAGIACGLARLAREAEQLPAMLVVDAGRPITLHRPCTHAEVTGEDGETRTLEIVRGTPAAPWTPGYYDLVLDGEHTRLAVAPHDCPVPDPTLPRPWGVSLQIPSLRGPAERAFGNLGELAGAVEALAARGADAVAINPLHALFPGEGRHFSPYSPSSRRFLNTAMGDPALVGLPAFSPSEGGDLIDWESALPERLAQLRAVWNALSPGEAAAMEAEMAQADPGMVRHATFDALYSHFAAQGAGGWQQWPAAYHDPDGAAVASFAREHADEVRFHLFAQVLAQRSLAEVQGRARSAGMRVGLVGDLAVGVNPGGSDVWSMGDAMLRGLTIGAPPDPLGPLGQNWGLTSFSPVALREAAYAPFIAMLRATFASAGGLRIDHAFGLARLWVVPEGRQSTDGVYLRYPFAELVRLVTLEAHRAGAVVIAEDLGTAPTGFTEAIATRRMLGMRVLWFERAADGGYIGAPDYPADAVAMTGTHDTATVAGWWRGRDLDWAAALGRLPEGMSREEAASIRDWDRGLLWSTFGWHEPRPAPDDPQRAVDAAIDHVARTPCAMAVVPIDDLLGLDEQPNLPGTVTEHPNWQRRYAGETADLLDAPQTAARIERLNR